MEPDINGNEFAAFEKRILLNRMSKDVLELNIKNTSAQFKVGAKTALRIIFNKYVGDLVGFSFPVMKIAPDEEDIQQRTDYELLPRFRG